MVLLQFIRYVMGIMKLVYGSTIQIDKMQNIQMQWISLKYTKIGLYLSSFFHSLFFHNAILAHGIGWVYLSWSGATASPYISIWWMYRLWTWRNFAIYILNVYYWNDKLEVLHGSNTSLINKWPIDHVIGFIQIPCCWYGVQEWQSLLCTLGYNLISACFRFLFHILLSTFL